MLHSVALWACQPLVQAVSRPGGPGWVNAWPFGPLRPNDQKSATHLNALPYVSDGACLVPLTACLPNKKGQQFIQPGSKATQVPGGDESRTRNKMRINTKLLHCYLSHSLGSERGRMLQQDGR